MFKPAFIVPCYNHKDAIARVLSTLQPFGLQCFLVDDGSDAACRAVLAELARQPWITLCTHAVNQGKGAAVMTGCEAALAAGYTHGAQVDADGQHDPRDVPAVLERARAHPQAVVTGTAQYDDSVPSSRKYGRWITHVWVWINTLSLDIKDSMCGLRVYPLAPACQLWREETLGRRMDFDTEVLVRLHWRGVPVQSLPVRVHYPLDGVSHFDLLRDNLRISLMHTRLFFGMLWRLPRLLARRWFHPAATESTR